MRFLTILVLLLFFMPLHSQTVEYQGRDVIIFQDGTELSGEILLKDWDVSPEFIEIKSNSNVQKIFPEKVLYARTKDFLYFGGSHKIDISSNKVELIGANPNPELYEKPVFLKSLINGKVSLLIYEERGVNDQYFLRYKNFIKPLSRKLFYQRTNSGGDVLRENSLYRKQLREILSGCNLDPNIVSYDYFSLEKFIKRFTQCKGYKGGKKMKSRNLLKINAGVFAGLHTTQLNFQFVDVESVKALEFDAPWKKTFGVSLDLMSGGKPKLCLFSSLEYQEYSGFSEGTIRPFESYTMNMNSSYLAGTGVVSLLFDISDKTSFSIGYGYSVGSEMESFHTLKFLTHDNTLLRESTFMNGWNKSRSQIYNVRLTYDRFYLNVRRSVSDMMFTTSQDKIYGYWFVLGYNFI